MKKVLPLLVLFLSLGGCAKLVPFELPAPALTSPRVTATELASGIWTEPPGVYRMRQSVLFEFGGMRVPMTGMLQLDTRSRQVRLVAMNDMGVKLFDLSVSEQDSQEHYVFPELAKYPGFSEAVASSVRRIFLKPRVSGTEVFKRTEQIYGLERPYEQGRLYFSFGGPDARLLETNVDAEAENWKARYFEYRRSKEVNYPHGIVLDDRRAGYRLTLWLENVRKVDE